MSSPLRPVLEATALDQQHLSELSRLLQAWQAFSLLSCSEQQVHVNMATFDDDLDFIIQAISNKQPTINEQMPCERIDPSTITILGHTLRFVGGLDISFPPGQTNSNTGVVVLAVLSFPDMQLLHSESEHVTFPVPYVPGYLGMREAPSYVRLLDRTKGSGLCPQVVFVDGNGRLHPRQRCSRTAKEYHSISDFPAILGSQKAMKSYCHQALKRRGDWLGIPIEGELVGAAVLSSPVLTSTRPIFVSAGHKISLRSAVALSLATCREARIPEPIRFADRIGRALAKEVGSPL
ncbi:BQ5605_C012g07024 [Microbotryum silenes-dioicae]|uniref:BQ5605_C012g07024 protein n=1 Tax=Microbotryum silenes-dioicae TaxID=796604 RepID=A0A2X0LWU0_9BASI|nr:BQ5605_C012g07024 [Microbotryum silenes-dioicae]